MEWVWVSVLLFASVLVWGSVKVIQMALAWKILEEMEKVQDLKMDLDLEILTEKWKAQGLE
jgi:hypothetical protein